MSVMLLNDTSNYHNGCKKVVEHLKSKYSVTETRFTKDNLNDINWKQYDLVVLNGEGTMHHNAHRARELLIALRKAQYAGADTKLVNTVWQGMNDKYHDVLRNCSTLETREVISQDELRKSGIKADIRPDASYFVPVPEIEYDHVPVYEGQYLKSNKFGVVGGHASINIFEQEWDEIVNRLRNSDLLITGRHHEMYAACVAECRFVVRPGNTWKNEGLLESAGVTIPFDPDGALDGKYDAEYEKLWAYLKKFIE